MLWAGGKYIMCPSWLQVSSKALDRILVFTAPPNICRGTKDFWGPRNSLFTEAEGIVSGQQEGVRVAHQGRKLGTRLIIRARLFSKC